MEDEKGQTLMEERIGHGPGALREFLTVRKPGPPVGVETVGNWYWIVDEIEQAGFRPRLVHAGKGSSRSGW